MDLLHTMPIVRVLPLAARRVACQIQCSLGVVDRRWPGFSPAYRQNSSTTKNSSNSDAPTPTSDDGTSQIMGSSLSRILTNEQRSLFNQVNQLSSLSRSLARKVGGVEVKEDSLLADIARLQAQRRQKHQGEQSTSEKIENTAPPSLFTVVFAGEFNSGKSTLINALLGRELLESGVLPTTDAITIMMADDDENDNGSANGSSSIIESSSIGLDTGVPAHTQLHLLPTTKYPILSDLCLIDTPGTNAILSLQHTSSTVRILHDADLIVFVTSADRPFSESEKQLLQTSIKSYRKRVVIVINKMDVLERQKGEDHGDATKKRVEEYVIDHAGDLLGARPVVIPLSARDALSVKLLYNMNPAESETNGDLQPSLLKRSNFGALENFLSKSLTSASKVRTKLLNPLGVSEGIILNCQNEIERRKEELEVDVMTLRLLTSQTEAWEKEIHTEVIEKCRSSVREAITQKSEVARRVLDKLSIFDHYKVGMGVGRNVFDQVWVNANKHSRGITTVQDETSEQNALERELQSIGGECVDTLSSRAHRQGDASIEYLGKRPAVIGSGNNSKNGGASRMVGTVSVPKFHQLKELQSSMTSVICNSTSDLPSDAQCADQMYTSLQRTVLISSSLLGGGLVPAALYLSGTLDLTIAMVASGSLVTSGALALFGGNRYVASSYEKEWTSKATQIESELESLFEGALNRVRLELADSVGPYARYVKSEGDWLKELADKMESSIASAHSLRSKINKSCQ